jgi:hypothetical protein
LIGLETKEKINHFLAILKNQHPQYYDRISISVSSQSNYQEYRGIDGRMRAELNYNSPAKYEYLISFPNAETLYYDMCFYVDYMWGGNVDVTATFDFNGTNYFQFTI